MKCRNLKCNRDATRKLYCSKDCCTNHWKQQNPERAKQIYANWKAKNPNYQRDYYWKHDRHQIKENLLASARQRAKKHNIPFSLSKEDIIVPDRCPILDIPLTIGSGSAGPNSPTLDRIIPDKGYIPGNVVVISFKANTLKSDGTLEEHRKLVQWLEQNLISE